METLFSKRLKELRRKHSMTQEELAKKIGKTRSTVAGYETERKEPDFKTLIKLSRIFNISTDYLLGVTDIKECCFMFDHGVLPVVCDGPDLNLSLEEEPLTYPYQQDNATKKDKYLFYKVKDDSMINSRIFPDDLVLIKLQDNIETGKIFLVAIEDREPVLRRIYVDGKNFILLPDNPHFPPYVLKEMDMSGGSIRVIGRAVQVKFLL